MVQFSMPQSNRDGNRNNVFGDPVDQYRNDKTESPEIKARRNLHDMAPEEVTDTGLKALELLDELRQMANIESTSLTRDSQGTWKSSNDSLQADDVEWVVLDIDFDELRENPPLDGEKPPLEFAGYRTQQGALARAVISHIESSAHPNYKDWEDNGIRVLYDGNHKVVVLPKDDELLKTLVTEMNLQRFFNVAGFDKSSE